MQQAHIKIIYTGGTIGMAPDVANGRLKPYSLDLLLAAIPELKKMPCQLDYSSFESPVDSSDMNPERWQSLGQSIANDYEQYDGFLVLHGSDTMAYTAAALSFMFENLGKPVLLTGSQLPIGVLRSDARENLLTALEIALFTRPDGKATVPEVAVYFEYDLYRGNRVYKDNAEDFEAFRSPNYPKLAEAGVKLKFNHAHIARHTNRPFKYHHSLVPKVGVVHLFPGISPRQLEHQLLETETEALVLLTFGNGNAPSGKAYRGLYEQAIKQGKCLVNVSQCRSGKVSQGQYAASEALLEAGVASGADILLEAALAKLMHLMGAGLNGSPLAYAFSQPMRGEMSLD